MTMPLPSTKVVPIRPPDRALVRFRWMAEVLASADFTDAEARVLMRLALHQDVATGRLFVSNAKLAKGSNQSERQARRTVEKAEKLGMLTRVVHRGRGRANNYNLKNRTGESGFPKKPDSGILLVVLKPDRNRAGRLPDYGTLIPPQG